MGKLDILAKEYMRCPAIFADVFNQFLYHGKQVIACQRSLLRLMIDEFQSNMREIMRYIK